MQDGKALFRVRRSRKGHIGKNRDYREEEEEEDPPYKSAPKGPSVPETVMIAEDRTTIIVNLTPLVKLMEDRKSEDF